MDETAGCELVRVLPNCKAETAGQGLCLDSLNLARGWHTDARTAAGSPSQRLSHPMGAWLDWEVVTPSPPQSLTFWILRVSEKIGEAPIILTGHSAHYALELELI